MGLTEESDAIALVLSEESGQLTVCRQGVMERPLEVDAVRQRLTELLVSGGEGVSWVAGVMRGFVRPSGGPKALARRIWRATMCLVLAAVTWGVLTSIVSSMRVGLR